MKRVDIACDLMDGDDTGYVWTLLADARDPSILEPGAIVPTGDAEAPAVAEVIDIVDWPARKVVHLRATIWSSVTMTSSQQWLRS